MTWTYSGDPSLDPKDAVRFLIGDVDSTERLFEDEEIRYTLVKCRNNVDAAAYNCCISAIARLSSECVDIRIGNIEEKNTGRIRYLNEVAERLKGEINYTPQVYAGGVDISQKIDWYNDNSIVKPRFEKSLEKEDYECSDRDDDIGYYLK